MKEKNIKYFVQFVLFVLIFVFLLDKVTWLLRGNSVESREDIIGFRNQGKVDVVMYGGSTLLRYYQPLEAWEEKGITSYNYATSSGMSDLLKSYIEESRLYNEAELYVCDIRMFTYIADKMEKDEVQGLRNWSDSLPLFSLTRWKGITTFLSSRNMEGVDVPSYYFDIIKYHTNTDNLFDSNQWKYLDLNNVYNVDKGFEPNKVHTPFETPSRIDEIGELTSQQSKVLDDLLDYCDREKLQVLFICCPYVISKSDWLTINAVEKEIIARGYDFINFNRYYDEIGLNFETDFGDVNHVNYLGAEKYTKYLMDYITSNYELSDHRGDNNYSGWDSDYEEYKESQSRWKADIEEQVSNHMSAKTIGDKLSSINDFDEWYSMIQNENFSILIKADNCSDYQLVVDDTFVDFINKYQLDITQDTYIYIWNGSKSVFSSSDKKVAETNIGLDRGRGYDKCIIKVGEDSELSINEVDYNIEGAQLQIVVYDNNYKKVIDSVALNVHMDKTIRIIR